MTTPDTFAAGVEAAASEAEQDAEQKQTIESQEERIEQLSLALTELVTATKGVVTSSDRNTHVWNRCKEALDKAASVLKLEEKNK